MIQTGEPVRVALTDLRAACCTSAPAGRYTVPRSAIPPARWPEVREHARENGLRATARLFGVSREAIRKIVVRDKRGAFWQLAARR